MVGHEWVTDESLDLPPYLNVDLFLARDGLGLPD